MFGDCTRHKDLDRLGVVWMFWGARQQQRNIINNKWIIIKPKISAWKFMDPLKAPKKNVFLVAFWYKPRSRITRHPQIFPPGGNTMHPRNKQTLSANSPTGVNAESMEHIGANHACKINQPRQLWWCFKIVNSNMYVDRSDIFWYVTEPS